MILWINGPFGSGKTTLATSLSRTLPDSIIFDPEIVGFGLRDMVPPAPSEDFQDLPIWRDLVVRTGLALNTHYSGPIVAPMTLVNPQYARDIFSGYSLSGVKVFHVWLDIDENELRRRIRNQVLHPDPERNREIARWRDNQVNRCLAARTELPEKTQVIDASRTPEEVLADVLERLS